MTCTRKSLLPRLPCVNVDDEGEEYAFNTDMKTLPSNRLYRILSRSQFETKIDPRGKKYPEKVKIFISQAQYNRELSEDRKHKYVSECYDIHQLIYFFFTSAVNGSTIATTFDDVSKGVYRVASTNQLRGFNFIRMTTVIPEDITADIIKRGSSLYNLRKIFNQLTFLYRFAYTNDDMKQACNRWLDLQPVDSKLLTEKQNATVNLLTNLDNTRMFNQFIGLSREFKLSDDNKYSLSTNNIQNIIENVSNELNKRLSELNSQSRSLILGSFESIIDDLAKFKQFCVNEVNVIIDSIYSTAIDIDDSTKVTAVFDIINELVDMNLLYQCVTDPDISQIFERIFPGGLIDIDTYVDQIQFLTSGIKVLYQKYYKIMHENFHDYFD